VDVKSPKDQKNNDFGLFGKLKSKKSDQEDKKSDKNKKSIFISIKILDGKQDEKKLEMEAFSLCYEEYLKQEENLSGVLNTKTLNLKNLELRDKIHYWRENKAYIELKEEKIKKKEKEVFDVVNKYCLELNVDKELIEVCQKDYFDLVEERHKNLIEENILNNFLLELDDFKILEIKDMLKCMDIYRIRFNDDYNMLTAFVDKISRE